MAAWFDGVAGYRDESALAGILFACALVDSTTESDLFAFKSIPFERNHCSMATVQSSKMLNLNIADEVGCPYATLELNVIRILMKRHTLWNNVIANVDNETQNKNGPKQEPCGTPVSKL